MVIRGKFKVIRVAECESWANGERVQEVRFRPEYDPSIPEDEYFEKATPAAGTQLDIRLTNQGLIDVLKLGDFYYLDLTKVEAK